MSTGSLKDKPKCPVHGDSMLIVYGYGWDYDRWLCGTIGCDFEIELETTTYPEEIEEKVNK